MTARRIALSSCILLALAGVAGYGAYSVFAAQGAGQLSQAPLNIETNIKPAFIMGVDDSGSMIDDELLFATSDGDGRWNETTKSFFDSNGKPLTSGTNYSKATSSGVPRADQYGAARDPEYNRAYFNPAVSYLPWQKADGSYEADSNPKAAVEDVRKSTGTTFDFTTTKDAAAYTYTAGMTLYKGTTYLNANRCSNYPTPGIGTPTDQWMTLPENMVFTSDCSVRIRYYPAIVYLSETADPPPGFDLNKRVLINGAGPLGTNLYKYEYIEGNFTTGGAAAVQNFANWWTYHGNRNRATIAAMTQSVAEVKDMRVGYFTINKRVAVSMYDLNASADRTNLYTQMRALNASGSTPLRRAVRFMGDQFRRTDTGAPVQLTCQKNASMLFTDGFTNDDNSGLAKVGDQDGGLPLPFKDGSHSDTIADFASWSYENNIRPDLVAGQVPVPDACSGTNPDPKVDCNKNQHVNFYGITLGAQGKVYGADAAATADPFANPPKWEATGTMNLQPANVDDIWHAALNTRGEFINAQSPSEIAEAMRRILASVGAGATPSGSIGLTGSRVGTGSITVVPAYTATNNSTDWYSTLTAQSVSSNVLTGAVSYTKMWEATDVGKIPAAASRNVLFGRTAAAVKPSVLNFNSSNIADAANLCSDALSRCSASGAGNGIVGAGSKLKVSLDQAVAYLRGDQTLEGNGSTPLRTRSTRLGDIVNSTPVISAATDDYGYANSLRTLNGDGTYSYPYSGSYTTYVANKKAADRPMVYVGANDGYFHGFDGKTGAELFAYAPSASVGHMGNLLFPYNADDKNNQAFRHTFFADGPSVISDAYYNGKWESVAVGSLGAGGRGVFGLNVTTPGSFGVNNILWEVNDRVTDKDSGGTAIQNNIGYVLGKPVIVPVKVGATVKWKAIFGNGYGSINNKAALFVVDIETGATTTIVAQESGRGSIANGLGNLVVLDRYIGTASGRDGYADTVYAGDQNGAVWKFDLRNNSVQSSPLFVATDPNGERQPILGGFDAASGALGGVMVYFGTGSFSFQDDKSDKQVQTVYGVLDTGSSVSGRGSLQRQTITAETAANTRNVSSNVVATGKKGWYLDLGVTTAGVVAATGERFVGYPRVDSGLVYFPTYSPESNGSCAGEGVNRLYGLNGLTGGAGLSSVRVGSPNGTVPAQGTGAITLTTSGSSPVKDVAVMSTARVAPLTSATPSASDVSDALGARCSMVVQVAGAPPMYIPRPCGRQSWRQVR
jgi:type IV pilus assembly protein PilY1